MEKLDASLRKQFKTKLAERMKNPRVPAAKLSGHSDRYKIKLRSAVTVWSMRYVTHYRLSSWSPLANVSGTRFTKLLQR